MRKLLNTDVHQVLIEQGLTSKQIKLLLFCVILLLIKFVLLPIYEWQSELKENTQFYQMQLRDPVEINAAQSKAIEQTESVRAQISELKNYFVLNKTSAAAQIEFTELLEKKITELGLDISSKNSRELMTKDNITTLEFSFEVKGFANQFGELIHWVEQLKPVVVVQSLGANSSRRTPYTHLRLRMQLFVLNENKDN